MPVVTAVLMAALSAAGHDEPAPVKRHRYRASCAK